MGKKTHVSHLADNEAMALTRNIRVSSRKLNLVAQTIRNKPVDRALNDLLFSRRRIAIDVRKTLESAMANAENNHQLDIDQLYVKNVEVGKAFVMKRFHARGRGRSAAIEKFFSHLRIVVAEKEAEGQTTTDEKKAG